MADSTELHPIDVFHVNRYTIARYLFSKKTAPELNMDLGNNKVPGDYLEDIENPTRWQNYQNDIAREIEELKTEDSSLHVHKELADQLNIQDVYYNQKLQRRIQIQNRLSELAAEIINIEMIQKFILNNQLLEKLLLQEEAQEHRIQKEIIKEQEAEEDEEDDEEDEKIEKYMTYSESSFESAASAIEVDEKVQDYTEQLNRMIERGDAVHGEVSSGGEHVTTAATTLKTIPLVSDFIRGVNSLREAYEAYKDPRTPERKTKMAVGVFGGLVSIGVGIVGSLLLAGTGLLAGAAAIAFAPIVAGALLVGVYSANLYRDHQLLKHANAELAEAEHLKTHLEKDFIHETENVITRHIESLNPKVVNEDIKIVLEKEKSIKELHLQIHQAEQSHVSNDVIFGLKEKLHSAYHERNAEIAKTKTLKKDIILKLQTNPRLARIVLQKNKLSKSIQQLKVAQDAAKKKRWFSAICMVGVGLALAAVAATGIGALVLGGIAAVALIGGSIARVIQSRQTNKEMEKIKTAPTPKEEHAHSSLLDIDYRLLNKKKEKIAGVLIQQQEDLSHIKDENSEPKNTVKLQNKTIVSPENKEKDQDTRRHSLRG